MPACFDRNELSSVQPDFTYRNLAENNDINI